ncbi:ABC transporter ATP-binding protein [Cryobacterium shii]|uniref:ABC transporter ATP-binding protein n=1 Tax=Cryobacterium shii TaxID=1259235 RepID=A0AAQ2HG06_9MICO|nr:ABC transporter ATP-binding protein [Cryobacterium shii]TFC48919.1 ABC transporter ATP-binding protein [Cryobacterium shii]
MLALNEQREAVGAGAGRARAQVDLCDVRHKFAGGEFLFRPLNATLLPGQRYALTGASGSGKSTLLSILAGWLDPSEGTVLRHGLQSIGWVFQNPHGSARRSVVDHVVLPLLATGASRRHAETQARLVLEAFQLAHRADDAFSVLSGGEAQRLMLARAVASSPDLLLVDEPTAQLDMRTAETVNTALQLVSAGGSIVVVATHDERTADACDQTIALSE